MRFSFLIPFWALSSGFLRVARDPLTTVWLAFAEIPVHPKAVKPVPVR